MGTSLVQNHKYLVDRLEHNNDQKFTGLVKKLVEEKRQAKIIIYEESQKTANVYADGWQFRLDALSKAVEDVASLDDDFQAASDLPVDPAPETQTGSVPQGNAGKNFQIDAESNCVGAVPEQTFVYLCICTL